MAAACGRVCHPELAPIASNWRADLPLGEYLEQHGIPGVQGVDTRALTKKLRARGALNGFISTEGVTEAEAVQRARQWPGLLGVDYVKEVTHREPFLWDEQDQQSASFRLAQGGESDARNARDPLPPADIPIVAFDYGMKYNILRRLRQHGFRVRVLPAAASASEALEHKPAGVFLSNGPADPAALGYAVQTVSELVRTGIPIFGTCLGHQILGQAFGGKTFKLKIAAHRRQPTAITCCPCRVWRVLPAASSRWLFEGMPRKAYHQARWQKRYALFSEARTILNPAVLPPGCVSGSPGVPGEG